jgi:5-methylcytosine-specific restriction endonuclease McrA
MLRQHWHSYPFRCMDKGSPLGQVRNSGAWTEGRYRSFITSTLRGGMRRWPPKWEALKDAALGRKVNKKSGKLAMHYKCAACAGEFTSTNVEVDHKEPVVASTGFVSWDVYIDRLFCEKENLQVLCKPCHKAKTKEENGTKSVPKRSKAVRTTNSTEPRVSKPRASRGSGGSSKPSSKVSEGQRGSSKPRKPSKRVG